MKTILVDAVNTFIKKNEAGEFVQNDSLFKLLETYKNPKIIVTNADSAQIVEFSLNTAPYPVFTMSHNPDKPDPRYFNTLLTQNKLTIEDVIYFEHNIDAVNSAKSIGINSFHYEKDLNDLVVLKNFLDENV